MPKNIFEQIGDALTGAGKREEEAAQAAADAAKAAAATAAANAQDEAERLEAFKEAAQRREQEAAAGAADTAAKVQEEAKAAAEARFAEQQRQMEEAKQRGQEAEAAAKAKTYTVKSGDSLWAIAAEVYGDGSKWPQIFEANRDKIKDANLIYPGQELNIP